MYPLYSKQVTILALLLPVYRTTHLRQTTSVFRSDLARSLSVFGNDQTWRKDMFDCETKITIFPLLNKD